MKIKQKIGIVGNGFVGSAVRYGFSPNVGCDAEVKVYDKDPNKSTDKLSDVIESDIIFLSVPTPSNLDGSMNIDIVDRALTDIDEHGTNAVILLRSTVVPGTTRKLQDKYPNLRLVFNPEFLTERSANFDFINQDRVILGGDINDVEVAEDLFKSRFGSTLSILKKLFNMWSSNQPQDIK